MLVQIAQEWQHKVTVHSSTELLYGCCVMPVIVTLKGVEWLGYRLTVTNTRLLIDRPQNLSIEIPRRLSCPPSSALHVQSTSSLMTDSDDRPQLNDQNGRVQSRFQSTVLIYKRSAVELVLHNCWLPLSCDYTSFHLTILISPRRRLIYYSHSSPMQGAQLQALRDVIACKRRFTASQSACFKGANYDSSAQRSLVRGHLCIIMGREKWRCLLNSSAKQRGRIHQHQYSLKYISVQQCMLGGVY